MERYARVVDEIVDPMTTRRENLERVAAAKK
jgi:hypothetical protein